MDLPYLDGSGPFNKIIISKSFGDYNVFFKGYRAKLAKEFKSDIKSVLEPKWIDCVGECEEFIREYVNKEVRSTAYILRCLQQSMINGKLKIQCSDLDKVSGVWEKDKGLFTVKNFDEEPGRLIMGFGPSASGKTFWAYNTIKLLQSVEKKFPSEFLSVDGGTFRESSMIYTMTVKHLLKMHIGGLTNLVVAGFSLFHTSIFAAGKVKKVIANYLKTQNPPNLYIPETLGSCKGGISTKGVCQNIYQK